MAEVTTKMTLVATFATNDFAVMVGDRRRTNVKDTIIQFDDCTKVVKVNNKLLVGHSGDYYIAMDMIDILSPYIKEDDPLEKVVYSFKCFIDSLWNKGLDKDKVQLTLHFAGVLENGHLGIARISSFEDYQIVPIDIPSGQIMWDLSIANHNPSEWLSSHNFKGITVGYIKRLAKRLVKEVSRKDNFVSKDYDIVSIEICR